MNILKKFWWVAALVLLWWVWKKNGGGGQKVFTGGLSPGPDPVDVAGESYDQAQSRFNLSLLRN